MALETVRYRFKCFRADNSYYSRFKWSDSDHQNFQIAAHAIGISVVTPKQIRLFLPYIGVAKIASHLYKYRQRIMLAYGLNSSQDILNHMAYGVPYGSPVEHICERWTNVSGFEGFTREQIEVMVQ